MSVTSQEYLCFLEVHFADEVLMCKLEAAVC